ncbi:MAG TPA: ATP-binding protein [Bryobacteraceae bacterium]|jgi:light-regulated signal transduction histidine kinase (bacteriophytochrome)
MAEPTATKLGESASPPPDRNLEMLRLVSDAAHELVGPVNQLSSLVALFVNRYRDQLDEEAASLLGFIETAGTRASTVANGLRTYFRIMSSECTQAPVNTKSVVEAAMTELRSEIDASGAEFEIAPLPDVEGDTSLLIQLFQNVIHNSLKSPRSGTPLRITISAQHPAGKCLISIADNGIGIDPSYSESVFRAFTKLTGHSTPGAGMGLTIAKAIVAMHGGRIWVAKQTPPGTTVCIELPEAVS